ncbi:conserved Plasmodium protein, unknown function [Plasmodium relictum]|uniref:Uncharacterized protein n=1 Tax=Plasmodium relictum TaxID=85471 RepID=A0A1J1H2J8_PLARL|nr:conserved Plasmodium protein, unknown function [Plasmodium relictum]CRG99153.1 conserved Plasmodium protein, unknown function [Plasmodium relictum]
MLENRVLCTKRKFDTTFSFFCCYLKKNNKLKFSYFSTQKTLIYEHIGENDFLLKKNNSIYSLVNYNYVNNKIREINSYLKNNENVDKIIENLYILCVKGNIGLCDERIKYYVNFILSYINEYINESKDSSITIDKFNNQQKCFINISSYLLFLNILKVLNIKTDFDRLLKYVSQNIHFFSIDVVRKIAFNHDLKKNHDFFFKEVLNYIYTLIQYNNELYFQEIKNINICINICTNFFFGKKYIEEKNMYDYEFNDDIIYLYNMNYIYINHIAIFCNLIHAKNTIYDKKKCYKSEEYASEKNEKEKSSKYGITEASAYIYSNNQKSINENSNLIQDNNRKETVHSHNEKKLNKNINVKYDVESNIDKTNLKGENTKDNFINIISSSDENIKEYNMETYDLGKLESYVMNINDFYFNYYMIDTIYTLFNYYTNLSKKKKINKELLFFFIPDVKNYIKNIILNFIVNINSNLYRNKMLKSKRIIASIERILKLGNSFEIPFKLEQFVLHYCNILLVNKLDLSLIDNIKILSIFKEIKKISEKKNLENTPEQKIKNKNINDHPLNKLENGVIEEKKDLKLSLFSLNFKLNFTNIDYHCYSLYSYFDNMIKLVCNNLKNCLHNSKGTDICLLIPLVYEFYKYIDEELKNILIVQITCNKEDINENNLINIIRVFSKVNYKNELLEKFIYKNVKFFSNGKDEWGIKKINTFFSSPKLFFLFFYYKSKNNLFTYKDIYYIENYIQNHFFEMNIKDFINILLIYYKNKTFLLPELLIKIGVIFNNAKKSISKNELLFCLFLLSKNYYYLSRENYEMEKDINLHKKINIFRKVQYNQQQINEFINIINDILFFVYEEKKINYHPEQIKYVEEKINKNLSENEIKKEKENNKKDHEGTNILQDSSLINEKINNSKINFNELKTNFIMMKILHNLYYSFFSVCKKKEILNNHHDKLLSHLFLCFNNNYTKNIEEIKYVPPLLFYFSYFNKASPFYFEKQILYILKNYVIDDKIIKYILLSHVFIKKKIPDEVKKCIKEYVAKNFESFNSNLQILCFKFCNHFLNIKNEENTNEINDISLFNHILNYLLLNLEKMKPYHYLTIYFTICNNFVKKKKHYIQLFYYMNKFASHYNNEQLFLILFYMYKTGYSKPKIRKKIRNLILFRYKKRLINLSTFIKYILPLDEFGIYHLFPIKFQNIIYNQLTEEVKSCVRQPLEDDVMKEIRNEEKDDKIEISEKQEDAPIYIFEQMVKNY